MSVLSERLRVGLVGAGFVARTAHIPFLKAIPFVELAAIADIDHDRAKEIGREFAIPRIAHSFEDLTNDQTLDVIDICTPPSKHAEIAIAAVLRGKDVVVEKPLVLKLDDALALRNAAREVQARLGVVLNLRYMPVVGAALQVVHSGRLGDFTHVRATVHTPPPGASSTPSDRYAVMFDFLPHILDLISWITQSRPREVDCKRTSEGSGDSCDAYLLVIEFETLSRRRFLAVVDVRWTRSGIGRIIEFYGSEQNLLVDLQDQFLFVSRGYLSPFVRFREFVERSKGVARRLIKGRVSALYGGMIHHKDLLLDFMDAFRHGEEPRISMTDGLIHVAILDAAVRSVEAGRPTSVEWHVLGWQQ